MSCSFGKLNHERQVSRVCKLADIAQEVMTIKVAQHQAREGLISERRAKNLIVRAAITIVKKEQSQWD